MLYQKLANHMNANIPYNFYAFDELNTIGILIIKQ